MTLNPITEAQRDFSFFGIKMPTQYSLGKHLLRDGGGNDVEIDVKSIDAPLDFSISRAVDGYTVNRWMLGKGECDITFVEINEQAECFCRWIKKEAGIDIQDEFVLQAEARLDYEVRGRFSLQPGCHMEIKNISGTLLDIKVKTHDGEFYWPSCRVEHYAQSKTPETASPKASPMPVNHTPLAPSPVKATPRVELLHQPAPDRRYELRTADDLALQLPTTYRVKNIFFQDAIAAIFGPSGGGKSFLSIDLALSISDGNDWFGYRVEPCDVVYLALEGQAGLGQRLKAVREKRGAEAGKRVKFITSPFSLLYSDDVAALIATVKDTGIRDGVIVLDTLNASTPGMDENASADMGKAIAATKHIREECGGLVILIHHSGKDATKGLRGHSSLHAALDTVIEVTRDGDRRCWKMSKAKDGRDGDEHQFRLDVLEVGIDEDGDSITSCVVVPEENPVDAVRRVKVPAGGNQRIVWDAVNDLLRDSRAFGQGNAPPTRPCIELEAAIEKISPRLATDPKRRNERTRNAITGLVNRGLLKLDGGFIWLT